MCEKKSEQNEKEDKTETEREREKIVICICIYICACVNELKTKIYEGNFGGEPTTPGEAVPGDDVSTELRLGRSASSIDIARDRRPKPTKPASIGTPDTKDKQIQFISVKKCD